MEPAVESVVREHLDKVLASSGFQNSERLCRFLRFSVDAKMRGEQDKVKEYLIGKEVFDRDSTYDPRLDPIVRVEARRLRQRLESYYAGPGSDDPVRFELPKGAYVAEIHERAQAAAVGTKPSSGWPLPVAVLAAVLVLIAAYWLWPRSHAGEPVVAVIPARWVWIGNDFPNIRHDEDLAERIAAHLARERGVQVILWPAIEHYRSGTTPTRQMAKELGFTTMVIVAVRVEADGFRVTAYLIDSVRDRKLNVADKRAVALDTPEHREVAAAQLARESLEALKRR